jgi:integrase
MTQLLVHRQSLGYSDRTLPSYFGSLDRYAVAHGYMDAWLTRRLCEEWVVSKPNLKPAARAVRHTVLRLLGRFLAYEYPQTHIPGTAYNLASSFRPHIYTTTEILALVHEASLLTPVDSLRPRTFATLIGLLYCTGLRISEALALRKADVDLDDGVLTIRDAKFHKTRAVPLSHSAQLALADYDEARRRYSGRSDGVAPFFINEWRRPCCYGTVIGAFLGIARRAGVRGAPGHPGPRLHDIRHSFAVHRLLEWYRDGDDVQARLPLLTTYMGHVCLVSTQVYLDVTAELLHEAASRFEAPPVPLGAKL